MLLKQMFRHVPPRRGREPLLKTKIFKLGRLEDLQKLQLLIANVFDVVAHALGDDANVSGHVVKRPRGVGGCEDGDAGSAADEEGPFVSVGVPVHLADAVGFHCDVCGGDGLAERKVARVGDADLASWCLERFLCQHFVCEAVARLLDSNRILFVDWPWDRSLEDVALRWGYVVKDARVETEVFGKDRMRGVRCGRSAAV